jgi:hypothetical protein
MELYILPLSAPLKFYLAFVSKEHGPPYTTNEHLIENSGEMVIPSKALAFMKVKCLHIFIFSQMNRTLDNSEDYCLFREYSMSCPFFFSLTIVASLTHVNLCRILLY